MKVDMKTGFVCVLLSIAIGPGLAGAQLLTGGQTPMDSTFSIVKLDPPSITSSTPERRPSGSGDRFGLTEGAVWIQEGRTATCCSATCWTTSSTSGSRTGPFRFSWKMPVCTDFPNVGQQTRRGRSAALLIGPNGLTRDPQGRMVICAMPDRNVARIEKDGNRTGAGRPFRGQAFQRTERLGYQIQRRDLFHRQYRACAAPPRVLRELPFSGFYLVKDGKVTLLDERLRDPQATGAFPNGIALSPDEKICT